MHKSLVDIVEERGAEKGVHELADGAFEGQFGKLPRTALQRLKQLSRDELRQLVQ